ncbi:hypothetical protein LOAG_03912 [Loa loa]|uniref:Uncharacterized protein n=1 Tax=Loa loa TaxID=7209 RepID=A0A1S0U3B6_LOALO|nr:hypothetical protein LOAG_03912 [Loa loa]EFO24575.1 hypothetical protein LOAG_03912 [Loa loa]
MELMGEETIQSEQVAALINEIQFSSLFKLIRTVLYVLTIAGESVKRSVKRFSRENFASKEYNKATQLINKMTQLNIT